MANTYFNFKQFSISQEKSVFKVGTDGVILGASADIAGAKKILDIGTGTGLIAIMLAQRCDAEIVAIEPDQESYYQAFENVKHCKWSNRIKLENTDLQSYGLTGGKFDLIVSNPPYFNNSLKNPDPRLLVARHTETLNSDDLLEGASRLLEDSGRFQLILPYIEGSIFIAEAHKYELYANSILKIKPLSTSEIRRLVLSFSHESQKVTEKFLTIEYGKRHEYTEEYINLTRDFYLKF